MAAAKIPNTANCIVCVGPCQILANTMEVVQAYIGPVRFHYTMATGVRPVYISANANLEGVKEQVKLLWGFNTVTTLGIDMSRFDQEPRQRFCDYVIGEFTFEHMDADKNRFTVIGTGTDGTAKSESYKFFHTFAYGGLSMVKVEEFDEFLMHPEFPALKELNQVSGIATKPTIFDRELNIVNRLLRVQKTQEQKDAELAARAETIRAKEKLGERLMPSMQKAADLQAQINVELGDAAIAQATRDQIEQRLSQYTHLVDLEFEHANAELDRILRGYENRIARAVHLERDNLYVKRLLAERAPDVGKLSSARLSVFKQHQMIQALNHELGLAHKEIERMQKALTACETLGLVGGPDHKKTRLDDS